MNDWRQQRGVALITVMVMFVVFVSLAAYLADAQQRAIMRTARVVESGQAHWVGASVEALAIRALAADRKDDKDEQTPVDDDQEEWRQTLVSVPVGRATVSGDLDDLSGRININSVIGAQGQFQRDRLIKLFVELGIPGDQGFDAPETLVARIVDWVDSDDEPQAGGAESSVYALKDPPYLPANQPMMHLSELGLVDGFRGEWVQRLEPYVVAIPDVSARENINFSPLQVLQTVPQLNANAVIEGRSDGGYESVEGALEQGEQAGEDGDDDASQNVSSSGSGDDSNDELPDEANDDQWATYRKRLDVRSEYFRMRAKVEQDERIDYFEAVFYRPADDDQPIEVVYRARIRPFALAASDSDSDSETNE